MTAERMMAVDNGYQPEVLLINELLMTLCAAILCYELYITVFFAASIYTAAAAQYRLDVRLLGDRLFCDHVYPHLAK